MGVSVAGAVLSIIAAFVLYVSRNAVPEPDEEITGVKKLIYNKYYIDEIYNAVFVKPIQALSGFFYRVTDQIILNKGGVEGLGNFVKGLSNEFRLLQTGTTSFYVFIMVTGIAAILIYSLRSLIFNA